jgi:hypothetical protein
MINNPLLFNVIGLYTLSEYCQRLYEYHGISHLTTPLMYSRTT